MMHARSPQAGANSFAHARRMIMESYLTVAKKRKCRNNRKINRALLLFTACIQSREEAESIILSQSLSYPDARHHCWSIYSFSKRHRLPLFRRRRTFRHCRNAHPRRYAEAGAFSLHNSGNALFRRHTAWRGRAGAGIYGSGNRQYKRRGTRPHGKLRML